jgi:hypothetical protein
MGRARIVVVFGAVLLLAQPAVALQPGVFVSPGSPAGKEYSFPLSVLRGEANGHAAPAGAPQPLFGVGVHPAAPASTGGATARGPSKLAAAPRHRHTRRASHAATAPAGGIAGGINQAGPRREAVLASLARPSSDVPQIVLIAVVLLVVAVAFGAGIAVARRRG